MKRGDRIANLDVGASSRSTKPPAEVLVKPANPMVADS